MPFDIGIGILISILASHIYEIDLSLKLTIMSVLANLIPDLDVFVELAKRGRIGGRVQGHHRELTHFPLTFTPLVWAVYYFFGQFWAFIIGLNLLAHFLHDSVGMGWGIKWWWPFSNRAYKFFSDINGSLFGHSFMVSWSPNELRNVVSRYGHDHWFRKYYLKLHPIAIFEFIVLVLALVVLIYFI
ncbi:MAG: metal-dependent hydrolase [bacterium]|nr:metal-dependent hydrolase [bacterium]